MAGKTKKKPARDLSDERGEYRPIYTVLIHGPDYQALSPMEKLVLIHLKLNLGPAGIGVLYSGVLAEQTGYSDEQVRLAIDILSARGWVAKERNVFWVVDGLKYEPSLSKKNDNHRQWLARFLKGLPKLNIVKHFCDRYRDWLPGDWVWDGDGIPLPMPITTTITTTTTTTGKDTSGSVEPESPKPKRARQPRPSPKYPHFPVADSDALCAGWREHLDPTIDPGRLRNAFVPLYPESGPMFTVAELVEGMKVYAEVRATKPPDQWRWWHCNDYVKTVSEWVRLGKMKPVDEYGPTERGRLGLKGMVA